MTPAASPLAAADFEPDESLPPPLYFTNELSVGPTMEVLNELQKSISEAPDAWVQSLLNSNGFDRLIDLSNNLLKKSSKVGRKCNAIPCVYFFKTPHVFQTIPLLYFTQYPSCISQYPRLTKTRRSKPAASRVSPPSTIPCPASLSAPRMTTFSTPSSKFATKV